MHCHEVDVLALHQSRRDERTDVLTQILQCKYEQGIVSTDPSQSTIQEEHELVPKSLHQCDPLVIKFQDHLRVEASGTVHSNQHNAASLVQNHLATTSRVQPRPRVPAPA